MKKVIMILIFVLSYSLPLLANGVTGNISIAGVSKYLWRGQDPYNGFSLQPAANINYKGFSFGFWGSYGVNHNDFTEADLLAGYSYELSFVTLGGGFTYYTFPSAHSTSMEVSLTVGLNVLFSPYLSFYYDFKAGNGAYIEAGAGYEVKDPIPVSLSLTLGYNAGQWGYDPSLSVLGVNVSFPFETGGISITPAIFGQIALDNQYKNDFAGSLTVGYAW